MYSFHFANSAPFLLALSTRPCRLPFQYHLPFAFLILNFLVTSQHLFGLVSSAKKTIYFHQKLSFTKNKNRFTGTPTSSFPMKEMSRRVWILAIEVCLYNEWFSYNASADNMAIFLQWSLGAPYQPATELFETTDPEPNDRALMRNFMSKG